jgi:SAM-dependent methyltransferase
MRKVVSNFAQAAWRLSCWGSPLGDILGRFSMYQSLHIQFCGHNIGDNVLSISHSSRLCRLLGAAEANIVEANYPEQSINRLKFGSDTFSAVVSDQVLEHIACTPDEAVQEVYRVLRPGGYAVHTTCFMMPYHGSTDISDLDNGDFGRFTPSGLARLHNGYSEIIAADGWGNTLLPLLGGLGLTHMPVPVGSWHPLNKLARMNRISYGHTV